MNNPLNVQTHSAVTITELSEEQLESVGGGLTVGDILRGAPFPQPCPMPYPFPEFELL